jgi:hypothetical protein
MVLTLVVALVSASSLHGQSASSIGQPPPPRAIYSLGRGRLNNSTRARGREVRLAKGRILHPLRREVRLAKGRILRRPQRHFRFATEDTETLRLLC